MFGFNSVIILSCWSHSSLDRLNPEPLSYHVYLPITKAHTPNRAAIVSSYYHRIKVNFKEVPSSVKTPRYL
jgi:hypothetical protein